MAAQDYMTMTPGSAVADTLQEILARRRLDARQAMMDKVNIDNTQSEMELRKSQAADDARRTAVAEAAQKATEQDRQDANWLRRTNAQSGQPFSGSPDEAQQGVSGGFLTVDPTKPQQIGPDIASTNVGVDTPAIPAYHYAKTDAFIRQDEAAKSKAAEKAAVQDMLTSNPDVAKNPAVQTLLQYAEASGDYSGVAGALATLTKPEKPENPEFKEVGGDGYERQANGSWKKVLTGRPPADARTSKDPNDVLDYASIKGPDEKMYKVLASKNQLADPASVGHIFGPPNNPKASPGGFRIFDPDTIESSTPNLAEPKPGAVKPVFPEDLIRQYNAPTGRNTTEKAANKAQIAQSLITQGNFTPNERLWVQKMYSHALQLKAKGLPVPPIPSLDTPITEGGKPADLTPDELAHIWGAMTQLSSGM